MGNNRFTNEQLDEIRTAFSVAAHTTTTGFVVDVEKLISSLTAPTLRPGQPVMWDTQVGYPHDFPSADQHKIALFTEDEVMDIGREIAGMLACEVMPYLKAQLDAIKYGPSHE